MKRIFVAIMAFSFVFSAAPDRVLAEEDELQAAAALEAEAERLLVEGQKLVRRRKYAQALGILHKRVALLPEPTIDDHYNILQLAVASKDCKMIVLHAYAYGFLDPEDPDLPEMIGHRERCQTRSPSFSIRVDAAPEASAVFLNGVRVGDSPVENLVLMPGRYRLKVEMEDYVTHDVEIKVLQDSPKEFSPRLKKKVYFGNVMITSQPSGAVVRISERPCVDKKGDCPGPLCCARVSRASRKVGKTPFGPLRMKVGKHYVELRKEGYDRFVRNVEVERDQTYEFEAELQLDSKTAPDAKKVSDDESSE